jgi:pimeloyl-ACP methyl ester carboxylesterase
MENNLFQDGDIKSWTSGDDTNIIFVGYSIGCYFILEMLSRLKPCVKARVKHAFLLMPTIERMKETKNGKWLTLMTSSYFLWFIYLLAFLIQFLPYFLKKPLASMFIKFGLNREMTMIDRLPEILIGLGGTFSCARSCLHLGRQEMHVVRGANQTSIRDNLHMLTFYYGANDKWCPMSYAHDMRDFLDSLEIPHSSGAASKLPTLILDQHGLDHEFVIYKDQCHKMATLVGQYIKEIL